MADLSSILLASAQGDRNTENALQEWLQTNPADLAQNLAQFLANDSKAFAARQVATIYLKNMLMAQSVSVQKEKYGRWKAIDQQVRNVIKECLLHTLRNPMSSAAAAAATNGQPPLEHGLPHFVAVTIAEIAVVELLFKEWPELVPNLMENVTSPTVPDYVKIASLQCLGYTLERIENVETLFDDATWPELPPATVDSMLTTIVDGVQPSRPEPMRFAALTALKNSLLFVKKNFENKQERDFIMKAICHACTSLEPKVRALAYSCFDTVAEYHYERLQDYMTDIFNLSTECIRNEQDDNVKMAAIEVWTQLATVEQRLLDDEREAAEMGLVLPRAACPKYVEAAMEHLVPLLLQTLTQQQEDSEGEELWDLTASGAVCLETISQTVEGAILPHVIPFVQQHIQSADWRYRDAAINAFSSILDGPSTEQVADYVTQSIQVLLQSFQDQDSTVRWSAVHCIRKICKLHMAAVPAQATHAILEHLLQKLQDGRAAIASASCSAIFDMAAAFKPMGEVTTPQTNLLSAPMLPLMQNLLAASDREDGSESNLRVAAMSAAAELIGASALDVEPIFSDLLPAIIGRTDAALKIQVISKDDREDKEQVLGLLCGLLQTLYMRMQKENVLQYTDQVMQLLLQVLQLHDASCQEEAFMAIGAVATKVEEEFTKYMQVFTPILLQGLAMFSVTSLCLTAVGVVVDVCGAIEQAIQPYADAIMSALFACVRDETVHRDVKPSVISCFGDMAMAVGGAFDPYLHMTVMLLMQASQQHAPADNEDLVYFINHLRASVLEAYSGIIVGFADAQAIGRFESSLPNVLQFLNFLSGESTKDEVVLQKAIALIGDIAREMGSMQAVKEQLSQPYMAQLLREGLAATDDQIRDTAAWTSQAVESATRS